MDHLSGVKQRKDLNYIGEVGLKEAFQSIAGKLDKNILDGVERMAAKIAFALSQVNKYLNFYSNYP